MCMISNYRMLAYLLALWDKLKEKFQPVDVLLMITHFVSTIIILFVLWRFLYSPLKRLVRRRRQFIDLKIKEAKKREEESIVKRETTEQNINQMYKTVQKEIKRIEEDAQIRHEKIIRNAYLKSTKVLGKAEQEMENKKQEMEREMHQRFVSTSVLVARKIIEKEINQSKHIQIVDEFIKKIGQESKK